MRRISDGYYAHKSPEISLPIWEEKPRFYNSEQSAKGVFDNVKAWQRVKFPQWGEIELIMIALHNDDDSKILERS